MWERLGTNYGRKKKNSNGETRQQLSLTGGHAVLEVTGDALLPRLRVAESSGLAAGGAKRPLGAGRGACTGRSRRRRPRGRAGSDGSSWRLGEVGAAPAAWRARAPDGRRAARRLDFAVQEALPGGEAGGRAPRLVPRDARRWSWAGWEGPGGPRRGPMSSRAGLGRASRPRWSEKRGAMRGLTWPVWVVLLV